MCITCTVIIKTYMGEHIFRNMSEVSWLKLYSFVQSLHISYKSQVHYCDHALSVVRPSVRRPSLTFHIFDFSSETAKRNSTFTGSKISTFSTKFVFFGPFGKTRWPPWPLIGWDIFDFFSETAERNSTKLDRKQDLNVLYQVCVFRADRKNKMAALASDWLRHFRLLLWNRWTEFN